MLCMLIFYYLIDGIYTKPTTKSERDDKESDGVLVFPLGDMVVVNICCKLENQ